MTLFLPHILSRVFWCKRKRSCPAEFFSCFLFFIPFYIYSSSLGGSSNVLGPIHTAFRPYIAGNHLDTLKKVFRRTCGRAIRVYRVNVSLGLRLIYFKSVYTLCGGHKIMVCHTSAEPTDLFETG